MEVVLSAQKRTHIGVGEEAEEHCGRKNFAQPQDSGPLLDTHLLPVIPSNVGLVAIGKGFCKCNEDPEPADLKVERFSLVGLTWSDETSKETRLFLAIEI